MLPKKFWKTIISILLNIHFHIGRQSNTNWVFQSLKMKILRNKWFLLKVIILIFTVLKNCFIHLSFPPLGNNLSKAFQEKKISMTFFCFWYKRYFHIGVVNLHLSFFFLSHLRWVFCFFWVFFFLLNMCHLKR